MAEFQGLRIEIRHFLMGFRNGHHYAKIQCPICKIWIDGPVFIEEGQRERARGKRNATMKNFFTDKKYEKWVEEKTTQLLKDYGYFFVPA